MVFPFGVSALGRVNEDRGPIVQGRQYIQYKKVMPKIKGLIWYVDCSTVQFYFFKNFLKTHTFTLIYRIKNKHVYIKKVLWPIKINPLCP